jgi:putative transcriptional regulator
MLLDGDLNQDLSVTPGCLLVSEPFLADPNFDRTVVLVCQHQTEQGTFGLVLNRPAKLNVHEATQFEYIQHPLYVGGPVEEDTLHVIHRLPDLEGAIPLKDGLYWGGKFEHLEWLGQQQKLSAANARFFAGYSGWGPRQLAGELKQNAWVIARVDIGDLLRVEPAQLWAHTLRLLGGKFRAFANFPQDPRVN